MDERQSYVQFPTVELLSPRSPRSVELTACCEERSLSRSTYTESVRSQTEEEDSISGVLATHIREHHENRTLTNSDYLRMGSAFVLPGLLAISPVLMPFGNPFAKDGDNGLATNWAYYFWYTPIGWGAMWIKMSLWNCELFGIEFCFPFMHNRPGIFKCNASFAVVVSTTCFATGLFVMGYQIFHNPVPFGTISFGLPCFLAAYIFMYFCMVPSEMKQTWNDHVELLRCWVPFGLFVIALCGYMSLIWLQTFVISTHENMHMLFFGNLSVQICFIMWRELFASIPLKHLMGCKHEQLAILWNLAYGAICSSMSDWIFPGMPTHMIGICTAAAVMGTNFSLTLFAFHHHHQHRHVKGCLEQIMNCAVDVISGWAFLFIFSYNAFGPNQDAIYMIDGFTEKQKVEAVCMISMNLFVNLMKLVLVIQSMRHDSNEDFKDKVLEFSLLALREWYWLILWLLVSSCCCCGACMVMMHDGMDFTFTFKEWQGTWPFV